MVRRVAHRAAATLVLPAVLAAVPGGWGAAARAAPAPAPAPIAAAPAAAASPAPRSPEKKVAILVFDGVQTIDYAAPLEVLGGMFETFTVGPTGEPVRTAHGQRLTPDYAFADAPPAEILVVPGGGSRKPGLSPVERAMPVHDQPTVVPWVRERAAAAEIVLSVCNGAFVLAHAGLLDGREATTNGGMLALLSQVAPTVAVRRDRRFVDSGKVITAGGLSAGIDAALHVVERVHGRGTAQLAALAIEYPWDPAGNWSRAALADRFMMFRFDVPPGASTSLSREGGRDGWESRWRLTFGSSPGEVRRALEAAIDGGVTWGPPPPSQWVREVQVGAADGGVSRWRFTDEDGAPWRGSLRVDGAPGEAAGVWIATLAVERLGG